MAGLDCIAMAVAHLEREEEQHSSDDSYQRMSSSPAVQRTPIPQRLTFENTPRRVSSDSMYEEQTSPAPNSPTASAPRQDSPAVADGMSPENITRLVDSLSDDGEFQGPPPPPPAANEVITLVMDSDVLCGRGGETNHHSGNVKYRTLVKKYQPLYIMSKRRDKPRIAEKIVRVVRHMGGRFLRKDKSNTWRDVGNQKAREKTSQALREGAPDLRTPGKGKEEQPQSAPPQTRKFDDYSSGSPGFNMGSPSSMYSSGPSVVEMQPGDTAYQPSPKRMRFGDMGTTMHGLSQFFGVPGQGLTPSIIASQLNYQSNCPQAMGVSPKSFVPTVSADADESKAEEQKEAPKSKPRGPRLKLLKKRLQAEESQN